MKHDETKQSEQKKVFDVTRPGRMAASATSRPVIVGHKPQVKDPMVSDEERKLMDSKHKVTVEPSTAPALSATAPADKPIEHTPEKDHAFPTDGLASVATNSVLGAPSEDNAADKEPALPPADLSDVETPESEKVSGAPALSAEAVTLPEDSAKDNTEVLEQENDLPVSPMPSPVAPSESATTGVVFDETPAPKPAQPVEGAEPLPVLPEEEPMAQQVVISHHKESNKSGVIIILLALLVLGVIIFDVLLDAGIIVLEGIPHTDFF